MKEIFKKLHIIPFVGILMLMALMLSCSMNGVGSAETTVIDGASSRGAALWRIWDITINSNLDKWCIANRNEVFWWDYGRYEWVQVHGVAAARISVGPNNWPVVCQPNGDIFRWMGSSWFKFPGRATDVCVAGNGDIYIVGSDAGSQRRIWKYIPGPSGPGTGTWQCWSNVMTHFDRIDAAMEGDKSVPYVIKGVSYRYSEIYYAPNGPNSWQLKDMEDYWDYYYTDIGAGGGYGSTGDTVAVLAQLDDCDDCHYHAINLNTMKGNRFIYPGTVRGRIACTNIEVYRLHGIFCAIATTAYNPFYLEVETELK